MEQQQEKKNGGFLGIFKAGFKNLALKSKLRKERKSIKNKSKRKQGLLIALATKAWQENLIASFKELKSKLDALKKDVVKGQKEVETLQNQRAEKKEALKKTTDEYNEKINSNKVLLAPIVKKLKDVRSEKFNVEKRIKHINKELEKIDKEVPAAKQRIDDIKAGKIQVENKDAQINELNGKIDYWKNEKNNLQKELPSLEEQLPQLDKHIEELSAQESHYMDIITSLKNEYKEKAGAVEAEIKEIEKNIAASVSAVKQTNAEKDELLLELGTQLESNRVEDEKLVEDYAAIDTINKEIATGEDVIEQTNQELETITNSKVALFYLISAGIVIAIAGIIFLIVFLVSLAQSKPQTTAQQTPTQEAPAQEVPGDEQGQNQDGTTQLAPQQDDSLNVDRVGYLYTSQSGRNLYG